MFVVCAPVGFFFLFAFSTFAVSSLCLSYLAYTIDDALICNCVINYRGARWCGHDAGLVQIKTSIDSHLHIISTLTIIPSCFFLVSPKMLLYCILLQRICGNFTLNFHQIVINKNKSNWNYFISVHFFPRHDGILLIHLLQLMQRNDDDDRLTKCIFIR